MGLDSKPAPAGRTLRDAHHGFESRLRSTRAEAMWRLAAALMFVSLVLSACGQKGSETSKSSAGGKSTDKASVTAGADADASKGKPADVTEDGTGSGKELAADQPGPEDQVSASGPDGPKGNDVAGDKKKAQVTNSAPVKIDLESLPNDTPICNVAGNIIKVSDYKRMLRIQQLQVSSSIAANPAAQKQLLEIAGQKKIDLSDQEKRKLLDAARQSKGGEADFKQFLKQSGATEKEFDDSVLRSGLVFKVSNMIIESGLLPELVRRELLAQAAQEAGAEKEAMNRYFRFKHSKAYKALLEQTQLPAEALRDEIVKAELAKVQLEKLEKQVKVSQAEIKKLYNDNKEAFKHEEQAQLARIVVLCPEKDVGPVLGVRSQIMAAKPEVKGKELDALVAQVTESQRQKALLLLGRAMGGEDFAKLANENSDDPGTKERKNGGDMGWVEKRMLVPQMVDHLWSLKKGEVLKQLVKDEVGFTIYKVTGRRSQGSYSLSEAKPLLEAKLKQEKLNKALTEWLQKRQQVVRVEYSPRFLALAQQVQGGSRKTQ